jgi:hypothetical protein
MLRKMACLVMVVCLGGLAVAQPKDKGKDSKAKTKAKVVSIDVKKKVLVLEIDGKKKEFIVEKAVKFSGPQGGKATFQDKRLKAGAEVLLVMEGGKLKEVWLPYRKGGKPPKKDKGKDKKEKDK